MKKALIKSVCVAVFIAGQSHLMVAQTPMTAPSDELNMAENIPQISVLNQAMLGAWQPTAHHTNVPSSTIIKKFWSEDTWFTTAFDGESGDVIYHHGGSYSLNGTHYIEVVEFASERTEHLIDESFEFTIAIENGVYTQTGIENKYTESWQRLSSTESK
jgi:hypothetical protein